MKNTTKLFFFFLLIAMSATSCKKDDDDSPQTLDLPQYFECKVNGVDFVPQSVPFSCGKFFFDHYPQPYLGLPAGYTVLGGRNCPTFLSVGIRLNGLEHETGYLNFLEPTFADSIFPYYRMYSPNDTDFVVFEKLIEGEMIIEEFFPREPGANTPYGSIKGTFNFTVTDSLYTDTFHITNGRFRFDVPQVF